MINIDNPSTSGDRLTEAGEIAAEIRAYAQRHCISEASALNLIAHAGVNTLGKER